jgi:hypothetical protein
MGVSAGDTTSASRWSPWDECEPGKPMRRNLWKLVLGLGLLGCGGQPNALPVGFVNQTKHSDADLWMVWKAAQESLEQEVDLNPLQRSSSGAGADIRPGDPRALEVMPHQLRVSAEPDVSASALLAATGLERSDPTGMIACSGPATSAMPPPIPSTAGDLTQYAASWEDGGDSFTFVLEWSMSSRTRFWPRWVTA